MKTLAVLLFCVQASAFADGGKLAAIRARGTLVVSVKNQGPTSPELHKDPAHFQKRGYELEIAHALAKHILGDESKLELRLMPKATRIAAVMDGKVDVAITMLVITDERRAQVDFSEPYYRGGLALLVKRGASIARLEDLEGKRVGAAKQMANDHGAELKKLAVRAGVHLTLVPLGSFADGAAAVEAGKVVALVAPNANIDVFLAAGHPALARAPALLDEERYGIAVQKGNTELLEAVNATLAELKHSGELVKLAAKWKLGADAVPQ